MRVSMCVKGRAGNAASLQSTAAAVGLVAVLLLAGCATTPGGTSSPAPGSSSPAPSSAAPSSAAPTTGATPALDATVEAFRATINDPGFAGSAAIAGTVSLEGGAFPADAISGSTTWHGADVAQELRIEKPGRTTMIASLGRRSGTLEIGGSRYVLMCADFSCGSSPVELWSTVTGPAVDRPLPGPMSIVALLRSRTDLRHDGSETFGGRTLERLVTTEPVTDASAFGAVGSFGTRTLIGEATGGRIEVIVEADGRPALIRAELSIQGVGSMGTAIVALELAVEIDPATTVEGPPPSRIVAIRTSPSGYSMPVIATWELIREGAVDRWVAPGGQRHELRVHLDMLDASTFDADSVGASLRVWVLDTYGVTIDGIAGGFGGAINVVSTTFETKLGQNPTSITAGPLFWGGPGDCAAGDQVCLNRWSVIEIHADPAPDDNVPGNFTHGLISLAASLFREITPAP